MFYVSLISDSDGTCAFHRAATHGEAIKVALHATVKLWDNDHIGWTRMCDIIGQLGIHTVAQPDPVYDGEGIRLYISTSDFYR